MSCKRASLLLSVEFEEALDARASAWLDAHLSVCPHCRQQKEKFQELQAWLLEAQPPQCPESLWPKVQRASETKTRGGYEPGFWLRWGVSVMALVVLAFLWRHQPDKRPGTTPATPVLEDFFIQSQALLLEVKSSGLIGSDDRDLKETAESLLRRQRILRVLIRGERLAVYETLFRDLKTIFREITHEGPKSFDGFLNPNEPQVLHKNIFIRLDLARRMEENRGSGMLERVRAGVVP